MPACDVLNWRLPSSATVARSASTPYFLSHSSGSMPIEPSPSSIMASPRRAAASSSGRLTRWSP